MAEAQPAEDNKKVQVTDETGAASVPTTVKRAPGMAAIKPELVLFCCKAEVV